MSARLWGAVASVIFALLLIWVAFLSFGPESVVVPSVNVKPAPGGPAAATRDIGSEQILAKRTQLQAEPAVAKGDEVVALSRGADAALVMEQGVNNGRALVRGWLEQVPAKDQNMLQPPAFREGRSSLPYRNADVLVQPQGRDFRRARNDQILYGGGWLIFGTGLALALFLWGRGRIKIAEGESGETVLRFNAVERANHWMTASAFILMALTGLVILYGKWLLLPLMGAEAFSSLARASAWTHMAAAVPFVLGVLLMIVLWVGENILTRVDWEWLKRGGGLMRDDGNNPPAARFNAGQKLMFWSVVLGGIGLLVTGVMLMFPFYWVGYSGMQWSQALHAGLGVAMVALIIGHVYIGTVGMVGAISAMWSGRVDRNWAKEHHRIWFEKLRGGGETGASPERSARRA